jgi:hypothetical protein
MKVAVVMNGKAGVLVGALYCAELGLKTWSGKAI